MRNCNDPDPAKHEHFEQPVIQTAQMFIGEMGCWLVVGAFWVYARYTGTSSSRSSEGASYHAIDDAIDDADEEADADVGSIRSNVPLNPAIKVLLKDEEGRIHLTGYKLSLLALPAICDICGTTLMNVGLLFVVPSIYQMTRGMLVIWVGLFSVIFLKKRLHLFQWFALVTVVLGVSLVGLAGALHSDDGGKSASTSELARRTAIIVARAAQSPETLQTIIGILLIAGAQIFTATQFVLEEFILEKYALEPLKVVGWEGIFGFGVTLLGIIVLHLAIGRTPQGQYGYFDAVEGWREITGYRSIGISSILIMISIGYVHHDDSLTHMLTLQTGASTSSGSRLPGRLVQHPGRRLTLAELYSFGLCR